MYTLHPPPIVHNGNVLPKPIQNATLNMVPKPYQSGTLNGAPKPYQNGSLPRNFMNRHSLNTGGSSTLPKNFNLNMTKRCSMPANAVAPTSRTNFNLLHNVIRQQQQQEQLKIQQKKQKEQQEQLQLRKQVQQKNRSNQALNHANRKVRALGDESGFMVTIPASDKPTQLYVKIPPERPSDVPDFILNNASSSQVIILINYLHASV